MLKINKKIQILEKYVKNFQKSFKKGVKILYKIRQK